MWVIRWGEATITEINGDILRGVFVVLKSLAQLKHRPKIPVIFYIRGNKKMEPVTELETIKWLLVAILIAVILVAVSAVLIAVIFRLGFDVLKEQNQGKVFRVIAEDYLARDENDELIVFVKERLESHPQDVWAHWYMGQAKYHNGVYPESKRSFERVIELEPSWHMSVETWLEKINEKIKEGLQLVE